MWGEWSASWADPIPTKQEAGCPLPLLPLLRIQPPCLSSPQSNPFTENTNLVHQNTNRSKYLSIKHRRRSGKKRSKVGVKTWTHLTCRAHLIHIKIHHVQKNCILFQTLQQNFPYNTFFLMKCTLSSKWRIFSAKNVQKTYKTLL